MNLIISRLALPISVTDLNPEQHAAVYSFFSSKDVNVLFAWVKQGQLVLAHELPSSDVDLLTYFLRDEGAQITHGEQFESKVQYGSIKRDLITSLYHLMEGVFSPLLVRNPLWPESVRNEFSTGMNRLLSVLTDETNRDKGFTVLYVPNEDLTPSPAELSQNKELVQRLEATVIHWTRQIKGVLNSTNQEATRPNELPLDEIDFWRKRVEDLSGISQQLDKPGVDRIELVLSAAKSTYLVNFSALATQIKEGMAEAQSNVKFLSTLRDPCVALSKSEISKIVDHLPQILDLVRLIWTHSPFYNTRERITLLLQKVCVLCVKKRCSHTIP
jgi:dynein heavy chain